MKISKNVSIDINLDINDISELIWNMDSDEQAMLLFQLADAFNKPEGLIQLSSIAESIKEMDIQGLWINRIGQFTDNILEYLGKEALKEKEGQIEKEGSDGI